jgi:large subunit ribosomal protein L35
VLIVYSAVQRRHRPAYVVKGGHPSQSHDRPERLDSILSALQENELGAIVEPAQIKTHKATAKRFKRTGTGKLRRTRGGAKAGGGYMRHRSKRSKRKRSRMADVTQAGDIKRVNKLAPYL